MGGTSWTPVSIVVPSELRTKCGKFGYDLAHHIRDNRMDGSRRINREWLDPMFQAMGKLCEVMGAIACGVVEGLDWDHTRVDPGWDFMFQGMKVDVKGTCSPQAKHLIYPVDKTKDFDRHDVDLFLMVWAARHGTKNFGYGEVRGWTLKDEFKLNRHIVTKADWKVHRMTAGTWVLPQGYLMPMGVLVGRKWRDADDLRRAVLGQFAALAATSVVPGGDGKVEGGFGKQADASRDSAAGDGPSVA